jgi:hypothetical protein
MGVFWWLLPHVMYVCTYVRCFVYLFI